MEEKSRGQKSQLERLAGYILRLGAVAAVLAFCWYFSNVLVYIAAAFVVSLVGQPLMYLLKIPHIKGRRLPDWLLATFTLLIIAAVAILVITQVIPVVTGIVKDASLLGAEGLPKGDFRHSINQWVVSLFPTLGADFDIVTLLFQQLKQMTDVSSISGVIGSVASVVTDVVIGVFSVVFISFFFIKDATLFSRIVEALVPARYEAPVGRAIHDIEYLLSRYFVGVIIEMFGVALIDFLGLWLIAQVGVGYALGIAFIAGLLNVIPYVGPLIGELLGVVLCVVLKVGVGVGLSVSLPMFALIVFAIMMSAQLVDNFVYQPLIYSKSIRSTPLEIFIVLLMVGHVGGVWGMLIAIPSYTVIRVIAGRFFAKSKVVQRLMPDIATRSR